MFLKDKNMINQIYCLLSLNYENRLVPYKIWFLDYAHIPLSKITHMTKSKVRGLGNILPFCRGTVRLHGRG